MKLSVGLIILISLLIIALIIACLIIKSKKKNKSNEIFNNNLLNTKNFDDEMVKNKIFNRNCNNNAVEKENKIPVAAAAGAETEVLNNLNNIREVTVTKNSTKNFFNNENITSLDAMHNLNQRLLMMRRKDLYYVLLTLQMQQNCYLNGQRRKGLLTLPFRFLNVKLKNIEKLVKKCENPNQFDLSLRHHPYYKNYIAFNDYNSYLPPIIRYHPDTAKKVCNCN